MAERVKDGDGGWATFGLDECTQERAVVRVKRIKAQRVQAASPIQVLDERGPLELAVPCRQRETGREPRWWGVRPGNRTSLEESHPGAAEL
jgi:hypothetical protein